VTALEELAGMVIRITELKHRIDEHEGSTYAEEMELAELRRKLARMKRRKRKQEVKNAYIS